MEENRLKVLYITGDYLPYKNAGIENYTNWWIKKNERFKSEILVVNSAIKRENYTYDGVKVMTIQTFADFTNINLSAYHFIHFMEYSGKNGINIDFIKLASQKTKVKFTFHLPYFVCVATDLRNNNKPCFGNGFYKCAKCLINHKSAKLPFLRHFFSNKRTLEKLINYSNNIYYYADWFKNFVDNSGFNTTKFEKVEYLSVKDNFNQKSDLQIINKKLVFVGRIEKAKGLYLLCQALKTTKYSIDLHVYGNIVDDFYFQKCREEFPFIFEGTTSRKELEIMIVKYDALVLPSLFSEMSSMILLQASLQNIPIIASDSVGNLEIVSRYRRGMLFKYGDSYDLQLAIEKFYESKLN